MKNELQSLKENLRIKDYYNLLVILVLIAGMMYSPFLVTLGFALSLFSIVWEIVAIGFKPVLNKIRQGLPYIFCIAILVVLDILSVGWSTDKSEAWSIVWHQAPLFVIPLLFCVISPLKKELLDLVILGYIVGIIWGIVWGSTVYLMDEYADSRKLILGARNIAYSMKTAFAIIILCIYAYLTRRHKKKCIGLSLCFLAFLLATQMMSGLITLVLFTFVALFYFLLKKKTVYTKVLSLLLVLALCGAGVWIAKQYYSYFSPKEAYAMNLDAKTKSGNKYINYDDGFVENGYYVNKYLCKEEVEVEWERRTGKKTSDKCENAPYTYGEVIYRYMNSKGLRKDKESVWQLTDRDLENINQGYANVVYAERFSIKPRLYQTFYELERFINSGEVSEMSLVQRFVWTKNACKVISQNFVFGTGTGDEQKALKTQLDRDYPGLSKVDVDPHNQFVYTFAGMGLFGLAIFVFSLLYIPFKKRLWHNPYYLTFFVLFICYMLSESALRMVSGMMFYAFILSLFSFNKETIEKSYLS